MKLANYQRLLIKKIVLGFIITIPFFSFAEKKQSKPNILWLTTEDISPHLGCYGDEYAYTPTLDKMAKEGVLFTNAYSTASVCTPSRSSIITGRYASSLGTQHLRAPVTLSENVTCFTEYLREAGYNCLNFNKTDYNFNVPPKAWDINEHTSHESLVKDNLAKLPDDKPFFCVYNMLISHQNQTRYNKNILKTINSLLPPEARHLPDNAPVPPYYPNTIAVKENMAALHTQITVTDMWIKEILRQLEEAGLAENTIVFFYSDHGDGLPRHKRWLYDSGTKIPFIIRFPKKYQYLSPVKAGEKDDALVNFVDLAPTMLSITGCEIPKDLPGKAFLGSKREKREYTFAIKDRIGENMDFSRSVSDSRFQYNRNFRHDKARMPWNDYSEPTPIRVELRRLNKKGELDEQTGWLMQESKPIEEFYDIKNDPYQMNNLANDPKYSEKKEEMRGILFDWMIKNRDLSFIPEPMMRGIAGKKSPKDVFSSNNAYPIKKVLAIADKNGRGESHLNDLISGLSDDSPIIRYWSAMGIASLEEINSATIDKLAKLLDDEYPTVQIAAATALSKTKHCDVAINKLADLLLADNIVVRFYATMALLEVDTISVNIEDRYNACQSSKAKYIPTKVYQNYFGNALKRLNLKMKNVL